MSNGIPLDPLNTPVNPVPPEPEHSGIYYVNSLIPADELPSYLSRHVKGARYGREGEGDWVVADDPKQDPNIPPDPMFGPVVLVSVPIAKPEDLPPV